jgi:hypothetical protein
MIWVFLFSNEFFLKTAKTGIVFDEKLITFCGFIIYVGNHPFEYKIRDDLTEYSRKLWVTHLALKVPNYYR